MYLQELISQYRLPCLLYTDNGPPFAFHELTQFLKCNHIDHITLLPNFHRSNSFIKHQVRTTKTVLSTTQESR